MSTTTYDAAATARTQTPVVASVRKRRGLLSRLLAHLIEVRQRQAMQELQRHGLHLPRELEDAGLKIGSRNEDSLPFIR